MQNGTALLMNNEPIAAQMRLSSFGGMNMTMIEKVAKAIANELGHRTAFQIENHKDAARAAIEAMREPNKHMLQVGNNFTFMKELSAADIVWKVMIAAALEGK